MLVDARLSRTLERFADRPALRTRGLSWTYAELEERIQSAAEQLVELGVEPGDRVGIDLGNQAAAVIAIWAALRTGAGFACLDPHVPDSTWFDLLQDFRPRVVLTRAERLLGISPPPGTEAAVASNKALARPAVAKTFDLDRRAAGHQLSRVGISDGSVANLVYTSGSTGRPKGVVMSHASMGAAIDAIASYLELESQDVVLNALPLSFDYGLYQALLCAAVGACLVLEPNFVYPGSILRTIRENRVTTLPGVPSLFHMLLERESFRFETFSSIRRFTNTGAHLAMPELRGLRKRFPDARVYLMYGLTECKRVSYLPPELVDQHPESVGIPMPGCEVRIVDDAGVPVGRDQIGELVVRGQSLMLGYWERPEETDEVLRPGPWPGERCLWTGDLFRRDDRGLLYFVGRRDDVFKSRGEKVAPTEIERVLREHPGVLNAAVIPESDPRLEARIHAFVVPRNSASVNALELHRHCARRLEPFKVPQEIHFLAQLPLNGRGKVDKHALAEGLTHPEQPRSR